MPIRPRPWLLVSFLACYLGAATYFQAKSEIPPYVDGAPIEYFTTSLLWMLSLVSLLLADQRLGTSRTRAGFWLLASAGLGVITLDESFGFHERTRFGVGDDDHLKLLLWFLSFGVLSFICWLERPRWATRWAFLAAVLFQVGYGLVEFGDGDYFRVPLASTLALQWSEEYFELLSFASYLAGFLYLYTAAGRPTPQDNSAHPDSISESESELALERALQSEVDHDPWADTCPVGQPHEETV